MKKFIPNLWQTILFACVLSLSFSCSDSDKDVDEGPPLSSEKKIHAYSIPKSLNPILDSDITGIISENKKEITLSAAIPIEEVLIPSFVAKGKVYVGDVLQESGVSSHNLDNGLTYKVVAEDGSSVNYKLITNTTAGFISNFQVHFTQDNGDTPMKLSSTYDAWNQTFHIKSPNNKWIDNIGNAVAHFNSKGDIYVDGVLQESGVTVNDFRKEVIYKLDNKDGTFDEYKVIFDSPQSTGLPVIKIDIENGAEITIKESAYKNMHFILNDPNNSQYNLEIPFESVSDGKSGIRGRGNSTWGYPKKPYRIKFNKRQSLFGLDAAKSWVLLANWLDPTFITTNVAFELGQRLEIPYTNTAFNVELFINGTHRGHYTVTEQVQVDKARVNIDEDNDYFFELDSYYDEDYKFRDSYIGLPVNIKSPEPGNESPVEWDAKVDAMKATVDQFMAKLFGGSSNFPNNNYKDDIDIDILIDFILVNELCHNTELLHPKSTYMYKTQTGKFTMGPLWDFDWGFGGEGGRHIYFNKVDEILYKPNSQDGSQNGGKFFRQFFGDPAFRTAYKARWSRAKSRIGDIDLFIKDLGEKLEKSAGYDYEIWGSNTSFKSEISKMQNYMRNRINYIDSFVNGL